MNLILVVSHPSLSHSQSPASRLFSILSAFKGTRYENYYRPNHYWPNYPKTPSKTQPNPTQWKPKDLLTNERVAISVCWFRGRDGGLLGRDRMREARGSSSVSAGRSSRQSPGRWGRGDRGVHNSVWKVCGGSSGSRCGGSGGDAGGGDGPGCAARGRGILCLPFICFMRRGQWSFRGK